MLLEPVRGEEAKKQASKLFETITEKWTIRTSIAEEEGTTVSQPQSDLHDAAQVFIFTGELDGHQVEQTCTNVGIVQVRLHHVG